MANRTETLNNNLTMFILQGLRKPARDKMLLRYRIENPLLSLTEIGQVFGISRQRVHQILRRDDGRLKLSQAYRQGGA